MSYPALGTSSGLDVLLVRAFHAYRQGLHRQPQLLPVIPPRDFEALKFLGTIGWIPLKDRLELRNLYRICDEGLGAAREGRLEYALDRYEKAREPLKRLEHGTRRAWFLGDSKYQAGVAYLEFQHGRAEQARERLDRAMDADLELERAGLPVMQMHRIQQGHNLARMDFRMGHRESAVRLAGVLLAYMERQTHELPYHHDWLSRGLQAVPRSLLQAMIYQILGETTAYIVTGNAPAEEWSVLIKASRLYQDAEAAVFPQVQYALRAHYDRLVNNPEGYLRNLECFFRVGIRHCHLLWYAVMVELVRFCREVDTCRSRQVREVILRNSAQWKGLPPFLRNGLDSPVAQRTVA